jgi:hypothetical protein
MAPELTNILRAWWILKKITQQNFGRRAGRQGKPMAKYNC